MIDKTILEHKLSGVRYSIRPRIDDMGELYVEFVKDHGKGDFVNLFQLNEEESFKLAFELMNAIRIIKETT
tara:strand:+ start:137 stop:349 length:213 start_codon:yes stop_codon:yes gene_type:complete